MRDDVTLVMQMLQGIKTLPLTGRLGHTSVSDDGRFFALAAGSGSCSIFDSDLHLRMNIDVGNDLHWLKLNEVGSHLLVGRGRWIDSYFLKDPTKPPIRFPVTDTSVECCVFNRDENIVCVAAGAEKSSLSAWTMDDAALVADGKLPDRGGAGYMLVAHPEGEVMATVAYSGQSEEWVFWAHYARGKIRIFDRPEIEGASFPRFHPRGGEFVSHHDHLGLCRIGFPSGALIASISPEDAFPQNPEDIFSYDIHFSKLNRILAWQEGLALHELDLETLKPIRTVLTGVDRKTFGENGFFSGQSWRLAGNRLLISDVHFGNKPDARQTTLRLWDGDSIFDRIEGPDPSRPFTKALLAKIA